MTTTRTSQSLPQTEPDSTAPVARRRRIRPGHPGLILALVLTSQLMVVLDATIVNIALPDIQGALGFSPTTLSWVVNAYTLAFGGLLLLGARSGDLLGRRRTFLAGITVFTLASLAGGFAESPAALLAARAVQGVGGALAAPSALALLMTMFPEARERTKALGWYAAVSIGGSAIGLIAGGMLTQWVSWRWVLFVNVPIGLAVLALARVLLPETDRRSGRFDLTGALSSTIGMTALVYGFVRAASDGWSDSLTIAAFAVGLLLMAAFVTTERRAEAPITPLRLFADRNRATSYLARLLLIAGMMGMFFFLTQYLQDVLGYSPVQSGLAFLPLTAMLFAVSNISSRIRSDRVSPRALLLTGLTISTVGIGLLTRLTETSGYPSLLLPLLLFGLGNGLAFVPLTSVSLSGVDPADAGAASGLVNVMQQVGGALGLSVLVTVFGPASRHAAETAASSLTPAALADHAFTVGADRAFMVSTAFLALALVLVAALIRMPKPAPATTADRDREVDAEDEQLAFAE